MRSRKQRIENVYVRPTVRRGESIVGHCCRTCRHANQESDEIIDGLIYCKVDGMPKTDDGGCQALPLIRLPDGEYYWWEAYNGKNCTYAKNCNLVWTRGTQKDENLQAAEDCHQRQSKDK